MRWFGCVFLLLAARMGALELRDVAPVDAHAHIFFDDGHMRDTLQRLNLRIVDVTVVDPYARGYEAVEPQEREVLAVVRGANGRAFWVSTFDPKDFESPGFPDVVIRRLDDTFRQGAVGVKIYKTIGMDLRSKT